MPPLSAIPAPPQMYDGPQNRTQAVVQANSTTVTDPGVVSAGVVTAPGAISAGISPTSDDSKKKQDDANKKVIDKRKQSQKRPFLFVFFSLGALALIVWGIMQPSRNPLSADEVKAIQLAQESKSRPKTAKRNANIVSWVMVLVSTLIAAYVLYSRWLRKGASGMKFHTRLKKKGEKDDEVLRSMEYKEVYGTGGKERAAGGLGMLNQGNVAMAGRRD